MGSYRNLCLLSSVSWEPVPHSTSSSSLIFLELVLLLSFLFFPFPLGARHSSSTSATASCSQASCQTLLSHSSSTTSLVSLHLLYVPFLFNTLPLIIILTASLTWRSKLLWHFLTTLKLKSGCSPTWLCCWCSVIWLSSFMLSPSLQCSWALSEIDLAVSPT